MKLRLVTWLQGALLAFCLAFGAAACLCTAFSLPLVDLWLLGVLCALTAVLAGFCYCFRLSLVPLGVLALSAGYLWQSGILAQGFEALMYRLSLVYHGGYNWPILLWSGKTGAELDTMLPDFIYLLGILLTLAAVWSVCRGKSALWAALPALVPVLACFVVTDTLPSLAPLFLFIAALLVMMFTSYSRQQDTHQANRLTAMVALPVVLALGILFLAIPEDTYTGQKQAEDICQTLFGDSPLERLWDRATGQSNFTGNSVDGSSVDLTRIGIRLESPAEVMRVNVSYTGTLYLRGRALDGYTGTQWYDTGTEWNLPWPDTTPMDYIGGVVITTKYAHRMMYVPYYARNLGSEGQHRGMENTERLSMYSFSGCIPPDSSYMKEQYRIWQQWQMLSSTYPNPQLSQLSQCTDLPESTQAWVQELVNEIVGSETDHYEIAQLIGSYVRSSAKYDLQTRRMPTRETDFCQWFLESSDTGYCVHFASAATVLLKAAGIPARYVTGYMVRVADGKTKVVRGSEAHAWAEYWLPGFGWTILEATPAEQEEPEEQTTAPTQNSQQTTEPTQPETQAPTTPEQTTPGPTQKEDAKQELPGKPDLSWLRWLLWWLAGIAAVIGIAIGQWQLRLWLRRRRFAKGNPNDQILARWQDAAWLCRVLQQTPDRQLFELAQKAKFSQYTMTREELVCFLAFRQEAVAQMQTQSLPKRLWYRLILAAY